MCTQIAAQAHTGWRPKLHNFQTANTCCVLSESTSGCPCVLPHLPVQVDLPVDKGVVLLDIGFTGTDPNHGFLLGTRQTLLETFDGGKTWQPRDIEAAKDEGFNYR